MTTSVRPPSATTPGAALASAQRPATTVAGLSSATAAARLLEHGLNEPAPAPRRTLWRELVRPLASPIILILLAASGVAAAAGQPVDAGIIVVMVLLSAALNFVQTYRSGRAAEALRSTVAPSATVLRDGEWRELDRRQVVPGDVVRLQAGDLVPADARLLESRDLHAQQAALTGESMPVEKDASLAASSAEAGDDPRDPAMVFLGTSIVSGSATAVVVRTGRATQFGDIATRLATRPPETEFERGLRRFTHLILQTVVFLTLFIAFVSIALHRDPLESMLFAVALAVGLVPEFLPMITTVTLANGAVRMARRHVIVKHLPAIQNLGSVDVLCSDKTGTLTSGELRFTRSVDIDGAASARAFAFGWLNARFETGIRSPLDAALLREPAPAVGDFLKLDEVPFDFERRRLTVVVRGAAGPLLVTKGAPESVLAVCSSHEAVAALAGDSAGAIPGDVAVQPLDDAARARALATVHQLSVEGYRVLAVAWRRAASGSCTRSDERDLTLAGFLAFRDPPLPGVGDTVQALARDGVRILVLSGDESVITLQVCAAVGLPGDRIVTGDEVDRMTDGALAHVAEQATAFARLTPAQKTRVIAALRSRSHVIGFLGDGINDAPALHAADVGISVSTAVDVAKDAADVILMQPGLAVLHAGIIEGRTAFGNTMKYLLMGTSSSFGNMFSMAVASLALPFLPMLPTQILLNNFLYDVAQVTIPTDRVDPEYLARPHRWDMRILRGFMLGVGPVSSLFDFLTFFVLLRVFHANEAAFHTGWFMESLTTQTLVLFSIRTVRSPLRSRPSRALAATVLGVVALGLILPLTPVAGPLDFVRMPLTFYAFVAAATMLYLLLADAAKRPLMRRFFTTQPAWHAPPAVQPDCPRPPDSIAVSRARS